MPEKPPSDKKSDATTIGRTKDARGRLVTLLDPYTLKLLRRYDVIPADPLREIARDIGSGMRKAVRWMFILALVCFVITAIAVVDYSYQLYSGSMSGREFVRKLASSWVVLVGPIFMWIGAYRVRSNRTSKVMLTHLRCPHCGYDLRLLPADPVDHATLCPECGCAWRIDNIKPPSYAGDRSA